MVAGTVLIYTLGTVGFAIVQNVGLIDAFLVSAVAFIPFEAIKMAATIGIVRNEHAVAN
jgi:biotin transport system substrate-specific component